MKIDRLLSIVMLLLERKKMSAPALAELFEVNLRTIYRDIDSINQAGIPIVTHRGANGGFSIMEQYKIEKKLFSVSDITALLMGLGSIHSTMSNEELLHTMAKIKGLIPPEQAKDIEAKSNQLLIDHTPWHSNVFTKSTVDRLQSAIRDHHRIQFSYMDRLGNQTQRIIEPYRMVLKNSQWYVQGVCMLRNEFRIFAIDNLSNLVVTEEIFDPQEIDFDTLDIYFCTHRKTITLILRVDDSLRNYMIGYCGENNVEPSKNGTFIAHYPFVEDDYMYRMLLGFGDKCECLEPKNVREELRKRIMSTFALYEKNLQSISEV